LKLILISIATLTLTACGGSGGGAPATVTPVMPESSTPVMVADDQPADEILRYSFSIPDYELDCIDGSSLTNPGFDDTVFVGIRNGVIAAAPVISYLGLPDDALFVGGLLENRSFITRVEGSYVDNLGRTNTIDYMMVGEFTDTGWSGEWSFIIGPLDRRCEASVEFTGDLES